MLQLRHGRMERQKRRRILQVETLETKIVPATTPVVASVPGGALASTVGLGTTATPPATDIQAMQADASTNNLELFLAQTALLTSSNSSVQGYAATLLADHRDSGFAMMALRANKNVVLPTDIEPQDAPAATQVLAAVNTANLRHRVPQRDDPDALLRSWPRCGSSSRSRRSAVQDGPPDDPAGRPGPTSPPLSPSWPPSGVPPARAPGQGRARVRAPGRDNRKLDPRGVRCRPVEQVIQRRDWRSTFPARGPGERAGPVREQRHQHDGLGRGHERDPRVRADAGQ